MAKNFQKPIDIYAQWVYNINRRQGKLDSNISSGLSAASKPDKPKPIPIPRKRKDEKKMIEICLTNLGKYNEGELIYSRLVLPATTEEIYVAYDEIGVADGTMYEEAFISDYETDINGLSISEYASIDDLNELAEELENLSESELEVFGACLDYGYATDEALKVVQDGDYMIYDGCYSMADVAERYADETGLLNSIPDDLRYYFDFEAYGRDMDCSGQFIETDSGYIEIFN